MSALNQTLERLLTTVMRHIPAASGQYLSFMLRGEVYGIGILNIKEIIDYGVLSEVFNVPPFVRGGINMNGSVVPVVDLVAHFNKGSTAIAKRTCIVMVEVIDSSNAEQDKTLDLGILVDEVIEVLDIDQQEIEPAHSFSTAICPHFTNGMIKKNNRFITLLNVNNLLSVNEITNLTKAINYVS